ncbi:membrane-bound transcription factor site-2 protease homolog isoform X2 [Cynara cardunculus var. scolymus]|uniref:membrane-bound transcription factor site-2 protease homolog isoform X2 n=1 Tax=Cynara cardunculus var. scolymus TaxID=59895 RepID=UPI000D62C47C|nr:membrane-bound transcription factor site-2 protease homolog isoform X2 [Cynara cardunculus var. scolymus]
MAEGNIQLQPGRRPGRRPGGGTPQRTLLPLRRVSHLSNSISCWYCDFKSSVFNEPLFHFGRKYSRWLRIWFSVGMGFSLTTLIGVTVVLKYSISITDVGYMCISSIISVLVHELGHALAATSEGMQIEYTAVFLAVLFPGALVAFNNEMLQMIPRVATLRIYCAGVWHNAALCVVCALTLFLLPLILYPLYSHGESLMVLGVSARSPLNGYLSPGDVVTMLDGKHIRTTNEWKEMAYLLDKQVLQTTKQYVSNKGYCVPNLVIAKSKNAEIVDNQFICPNGLTLFTTISCAESSTINDSSSNEIGYQLTREHIYCFPAKGVLGEKKCGDGWVNSVKNDGNCLCTEDESCSTPIHMPGLAWAEITFSRPYSPECQRVGNKMRSSYNNSGSGENSCSGTFVFIGDMMSMARSIWLTEYQSRWLYGVAYIPAVVEKLLVNTFHVSLMLVLLNSLPVYHLDGESILEVALCCFGSLTPTIRKLVLQSSLLAGTLISCLFIFRILLLVIS